MHNKRPININPLSIQLPIMSIVSISHRVSGVLVFLLIPLLLWSLSTSLASPEGLAQVKDQWSNPVFKIGIWLFIIGMIFHLFAGIRHILMDMHIGDTYVGGKLSAWIVMIASVIFILIAFLFWGLG